MGLRGHWRKRLTPEYRELGELSGGELYRLSLADLGNEPVHTTWDAWGNRIDRIEHTLNNLTE